MAKRKDKNESHSQDTNRNDVTSTDGINKSQRDSSNKRGRSPRQNNSSGDRQNNSRNKRNQSQNSNGNRNNYSDNHSRNSDSTENPVTNDYSWYAPDELIGASMANFPYNIPAGSNFNPSAQLVGDPVMEAPRISRIPGVMVIDYIPCYGSVSSEDSAAAINVAARAMYAVVRKANSGSAVYESADLMTYFMAMDQIYVKMFEIRRILGLAGLNSFMNRNLPRTIIQALGVNYQDLITNFAVYVGQYNLLALKINNQFAIPNTFDLFKRRAFLCSNVFTDASSIRSQMYVFSSFSKGYVWTGTQAGGSGLTYTDALSNFPSEPQAGVFVADMLSGLDEIVNSLVAQQDLAIMSGDIVKAFGAENCFTIAPYNNETLMPVFDDKILSQIENAEFVGVTASSSNIEQSGNQLTVTLSASGMTPITGAKWKGTSILNSHLDAPDWKFNLEATRLKPAPILIKWNQDDDTYSYQFDCGSELPVVAYIVSLQEDTEDVKFTTNNTGSILDLSDSLVASNQADWLGGMTNFDWHPFIYLYASGNSSGSKVYAGFIGDVQVATLLDYQSIRHTHDCAKLGLLNISFRDIKTKS
nr:putative capsid [Marmot picobirnavirus]